MFLVPYGDASITSRTQSFLHVLWFEYFLKQPISSLKLTNLIDRCAWIETERVWIGALSIPIGAWRAGRSPYPNWNVLPIWISSTGEVLKHYYVRIFPGLQNCTNCLLKHTILLLSLLDNEQMAVLGFKIRTS